jgi:SAM-dependent methyltransferase
LSEQQAFWNEKFKAQEHLYGTNPNAYIKQKSPLIKVQGRVLCLGEGEGRNALFLAKAGHDVTAIDASEVGLDKARKLTEYHGHTITTLHMDLAEWEPQAEAFDAVTASYLHLPQPLRGEVFAKAVATLRPGGVFIGEFFSTAQLAYTSGGPKLPELLYSVEDMQKNLEPQAVEIIELIQEITHLDEGTGHRGEASVVRILFKKAG